MFHNGDLIKSLKTFFLSFYPFTEIFECFIWFSEINANICMLNPFKTRPLSYRNQCIDLLRKSMDWFVHDNVLRHERVKQIWKSQLQLSLNGIYDLLVDTWC